MSSLDNFCTTLKDKNYVSEAAIERFWAASKEVDQGSPDGMPIALLTGLGLIAEDKAAQAAADHTNIPLADTDSLHLSEPLKTPFQPVFLKLFKILPVAQSDDGLEVWISDPVSTYIRHAVEFAIEGKVLFRIAPQRFLDDMIDRLYFGSDEGETQMIGGMDEDLERLREIATNAPVIRFVDRLIDDALKRRASDIHIEPVDDRLSIRLRVDGILIDLPSPHREISKAVVSRIKILSDLDIAERRLPQDGRMRVRAHGRDIDFRVATSPTNQGESVVLRLLDRSAVKLKLSSLGFKDRLKDDIETALHRPNGIILVTGPTGAGKTTTLYAGLSLLNTPERKILTVEDPVEYVIEGLQQTQVQNSIGRTFAASLRSFLRQDPDIIMVGEIRDPETARIAVQASLTGHLVLSTLHTNSAAGAVARLLDMGIENYYLASTLRLLAAQRLVRTLCPQCRKPVKTTNNTHAGIFAGLDGETFEPEGCEACHGTGYDGRTILAEALVIDHDIERAILDGVDGKQLEEIAKSKGMKTMFEHGCELVAEAVTSMSELLRVSNEVGT